MTTLLGYRPLTLQQTHDIVFSQTPVQIHPDAMARVRNSYQFLKQFSKEKLIYGINTGFGPMAQYRIPEEDQVQLQYNLVRSHASGQGSPISPTNTRAIVLARLNTLLEGRSGIHPDVVEGLTNFINHDIMPVIYEHGSVGASGDLVQLAHLALALIGEGKVWWNGIITPTREVFEHLNITPLQMHLREGLGLMNGTSAMTGVGMVNLIHSRNLMQWSILATALLIEIVEAYDDFFSQELNNTKRHPGQRYVASALRRSLQGSSLIRKRKDYLYDQKVTEAYLDDKVQEYYSIRCAPQILGPIWDTITYAQQVLENEINSVNDNPIVDVSLRDVHHGGNFHGDYVALEMDKVKIALTKLSMLSERQLNFLLNNKLNQKLPPFVNLGRLGLNLGMQGAQFVATSTVAENQTYSSPMYVHSIPNNNDNQDIVSMGTNAALLTGKVIENTYQVLSVQMLTLAQAVDYLGIESQLSPTTSAFYQRLRQAVPVFVEDSVMHVKLAAIRGVLEEPLTSQGTGEPMEELAEILEPNA